MATSAENNRDPWGRSLSATLRRWWWIPVALGIVGAILGGLAGLAAPKTAEALIRVQTSNPDPQAVSDAVQSAMLEASSRSVYDAAAKKAGIPADQLATEAEVTAVLKTTFLSVKASGDDGDTAARRANALAEAAVAASDKRVEAELTDLTKTTGDIIRQQPLRDPDAEAQRVSRLGGQLADQQGTLLTQSRRLSILQPASGDTAEGPSGPLMAAMGLVGGLLAGVALALVFGGRRGPMTSVAEMRRVYPGVEFVNTRELPTYVSMEAGDLDRVVLTGVRAPAGAIRALVEPVTLGFHAAGRDVTVTDDIAAYGQDGLQGRPHTATVLQTPLTSAIVRRTARDEHALLLVLVRPRKTRFEWLDEYVEQFGDRAVVVVDG